MEGYELAQPTTEESGQLEPADIEIISNWKIVNDKSLFNTISSVDATRNPERANLEDVVSLETCIRLEGDANDKREPCSITIKLKNGRKIARIAIVSEAFLIELYKRFGEYISTSHAEFIDEFEQSAVYFADTCLIPSTPEITIKFARQKNPGTPMWLYGIRLSLIRGIESGSRTDQFDYSVIGDLLQNKTGTVPKLSGLAKNIWESSKDEEVPTRDMDSLFHDFMSISMNCSKHIDSPIGDADLRPETTAFVECIGDSKDIHDSFDIKTYIDSKLREMEDRLTTKIDVMNYKTNAKLDIILKLLNNKSH